MLDDFALVFFQSKPQRQPYQPVAEQMCLRQRSGFAAIFFPHGGAVERNVVKDRSYPLFPEGGDKGGAPVQSLATTDSTYAHCECNRTGLTGGGFCPAVPRSRNSCDKLPDIKTASRDGIGLLHLRPKESGDQFAGKIGGTEIHPGILIHLAREKKDYGWCLFP